MKKLIIKLGLMIFIINGCGTEPNEIPGCVDSQACNFNSDATLDDNSCIYQIDCLGECGGEAIEDNCGVCDENSENDCVQDCAEIWGGNAEIDECGDCGGSGILDACECNDTSSLNEFGCCDELTLGCDDICGSGLEFDDCGVCGGKNLNCISDIDGNFYKTVVIGDQEWMAENLKTTNYNNGEPIQYVQFLLSESKEWGSLNSGAYGYYEDNISHQETYGNLYNWYAVDDDRGICPEYWHIPTDDDWQNLEMALGMSQEEADISEWRGSNEGSQLADNVDLWSNGDLKNSVEFGLSGFNSLPSGFRRYDNGSYSGIGNKSYFWSTTENYSYYAWCRHLYYDFTYINWYYYYKHYGFSVRCVRSVE